MASDGTIRQRADEAIGAWHSGDADTAIAELEALVKIAPSDTRLALVLGAYLWIRDVMFTLGHKIGRTTVRRILAEDGIEPAPERRKYMPWATLLKAHWGALAAMDIINVEEMTMTRPVRYSDLVVMDLKTRYVEVAGVVCEAYEKWMLQVLRNLTDAENEYLSGTTYVIMDRDPVFTAGFRDMLRHAGATPMRLPRRSPNLNAFIERHRTIGGT